MAAARPDLKPYAGKDLTVIAWLWARTVASPDPIQRGAQVPLASSFILSSKKGKEAWVDLTQDPRFRHGWRFEVSKASIPPERAKQLKSGTKVSQGSFRCALSGTPIPYAYADDEANAGRMEARLMAVVAEGNRQRVYLSPTTEQEEIAQSAVPNFKPDQPARGTFASNAQGRVYGFRTFGDYFADRQLVALTTFSDLVAEAREKVLADALAADMDADTPRLAYGGTGAQAYADAVATYLGLAISNLADRNSSLVSWASGREHVRNTFGRQALPMVWDFSEVNVFSNASGCFIGGINKIAEAVASSQTKVMSEIGATDICDTLSIEQAVIATDPPYYDNISYGDLSDFFYVWQRRTVRTLWPELFVAYWCLRMKSWLLHRTGMAKGRQLKISSWRVWAED